MKRFLSAALVAAMFFVGIPAALATDDASSDTGDTTTTTTTTTTATTTTTTVPPVADEPPVGEPTEDPPVEDPSVGEAPPVDDEVEDTEADTEPPADEPRVPAHQVRRVDVTRNIVFPVAGINYYYPGFGDCRDDCDREHHGIDIMTYGWKGVPVVAAHSGTIRKVRDDREWCIVEVTAPDRW
ncbi:MAG: hypothetical protein U9N78_09625, partial [Actinomycetota bacterium]|nr:hypothetical protein [Actinomycetota bacterium]